MGGADEKLPAGYEVRRALRALPLLAVVTGGLYLLAQTDFLFPKPAINPAEQPQKPKTVPLSQVEDRVLFSVESQLSGPWRVGSLDVYDGKDWRLPAFSESRLADVPRDGVVNKDLSPGVRATFTIAGLGGTVLPGLPNTVGIVAEGPKLAYDDPQRRHPGRPGPDPGRAQVHGGGRRPPQRGGPPQHHRAEPAPASTASPTSRRRRRRSPTCSTRRRSPPSGTSSTSSAPTSCPT